MYPVHRPCDTPVRDAVHTDSGYRVDSARVSRSAHEGTEEGPAMSMRSARRPHAISDSRPAIAIGTTALMVAALALTVAARAQELNPRIESLLSASKLPPARVGVVVTDLSTGRVLADVRGDESFIPASNMKLITAGVALHVLGEAFAFRTEILCNGTRVILRGSGDPALADPAVLERSRPRLSVESLIDTLAQAVTRTGIRAVSNIIVDDRVFDRQYVHPSWPGDQLDRWYCAQVTGLNFHTNVLAVYPAPSPEGPGRPPTFTLQPHAPWLPIENRARTIAQGRNAVWLARDPGGNRFTLFGEVRFPTRVPVEITVHEPQILAGQLLATALIRQGVSVAGVPAQSAPLDAQPLTRVLSAVRLAEPDETLDGVSVAVISTPLADILERCNNDSQNLYAEALLKRMGREVAGEPGSWQNGSAVIRTVLVRSLGPAHAKAFIVADGSGMSRENRLTPRALVRWLQHMAESPLRQSYMASLATPGEGTLRRRFAERALSTTLRAKSGKLDGVRCLSGYIADESSSRAIAFAILINDLNETTQVPQALKFQEDVITMLDRWLKNRPSAQAGSVR